jgi:hypothetical protein
LEEEEEEEEYVPGVISSKQHTPMGLLNDIL